MTDSSVSNRRVSFVQWFESQLNKAARERRAKIGGERFAAVASAVGTLILIIVVGGLFSLYIHSFWKWSTLMNGDSGGKADDMLNVVLARIHITVVLIGYTIGGLAFLTVAVRLFRDDELFSGVVFLIVGIGLASVGICLTVKWGYNALINQPLVPPKDHFVRNAILDFNGGWLVLSGVLIWVLGATLVSLNDLRYWRPGD